jgi:UPF0755 protein
MEDFPFSNNNFPVEGNVPKTDFFKKKIFAFSASLIFLLVLSYILLLSAPANFPKGIIVPIGKGDTLREISLVLKEKKIIRSRVAFETFIISLGAEKHIAQGDYLFENKLPVFLIAERIAQKDRHLASLRITIPEGFDVVEIADLASSKLKNFDRGNFLAQAREGYLFPDTYFFFSTDSEEDVLKYLTENFEKKIKPLKTEIISSGKTENEILSMASLVEREAKGDTDRGYISGILWNRLKKGMPLQVDSAPETYKTKGLPQDPICNPGLEAIRAAIHPTNSNYLYYLHDENGIIHYARTFEEHKINKSKYLK